MRHATVKLCVTVAIVSTAIASPSARGADPKRDRAPRRRSGAFVKKVGAYRVPRYISDLARVGNQWSFRSKGGRYRAILKNRTLAAKKYPVESTSIIRACDLDGDKVPEVVAFDGDVLAVFSPEGKRLASSPPDPRLAVPKTARSVGPADLDGDGTKELVYAWEHSGPGNGVPERGGLVALRYDSTAGTLVRIGDIDNIVDKAGYADLSTVTSGDLDGDGKEEAVTGNQNGYIWIFTMRNGTFELARTMRSLEGGAVAVHVADMDGDGRAEIVEGTNGGNVNVRRFDDAFAAQTVWSQDIGRLAYRLYLVDVDADGFMDIVARHSSTDRYDKWRITILRGQGLGKWRPAWYMDYKKRPWVECADVDSNGSTELMVIGQDHEGIMLIYGCGAYKSAKAFR